MDPTGRTRSLDKSRHFSCFCSHTELVGDHVPESVARVAAHRIGLVDIRQHVPAGIGLPTHITMRRDSADPNRNATASAEVASPQSTRWSRQTQRSPKRVISSCESSGIAESGSIERYTYAYADAVFGTIARNLRVDYLRKLTAERKRIPSFGSGESRTSDEQDSQDRGAACRRPLPVPS
jgi:hypothetical protein